MTVRDLYEFALSIGAEDKELTISYERPVEPMFVETVDYENEFCAPNLDYISNYESELVIYL